MVNLWLPKKQEFRFILSGLLAGIAFNYLFDGKALGISYPIYVLILLSFFWWSAPQQLTVSKSFGWLVLLPVALLSIIFAVHANPVLQLLNSLLLPILIVGHTLLVTAKCPTSSVVHMFKMIFRQLLPETMHNWPKPFLFIAQELRPQEHGTKQILFKKIGLGLLISVPVLVVVVPLLSSADMVFNYYIASFANSIDLLHLKALSRQSLIMLLVMSYVASYLWSFQSREPFAERSRPTVQWDGTIVLTLLFVINAVYLLFSIVQFSYLYGGDGQALPTAFTYAEYARKGFFELVAVTIINLSILLGCLKFVHTKNRTLQQVLKISLNLLVIFSLNMLFSAHFKMSLYEQAYGLTYLRVFVHYFLALLLALFLLALTSTWLSRIPLVKAALVVTLIFYTSLNLLNVDQIIARYNFEIYFTTGRLDTNYLQSLSNDAVPEIVRQAAHNQNLARALTAFLVSKAADLKDDKPWQSFNYARYQASLALREYPQFSSIPKQ